MAAFSNEQHSTAIAVLRANPKGQRQDSHRREGRILQQHANAKSES